MGSSRPRNSTRATKARSVKNSPPSHRRAAHRSRSPTKPRIPAAIEIAIDEQSDSLGVAISLVYCLHAALRREIEGPAESEAVEDAAESADLTDVTAMLLVRLNAIHAALDPVSLQHADIDTERVELTEAVRKQQIGDDAPGASL
jgi:hypothetical protein